MKNVNAAPPNATICFNVLWGAEWNLEGGKDDIDRVKLLDKNEKGWKGDWGLLR